MRLRSQQQTALRAVVASFVIGISISSWTIHVSDAAFSGTSSATTRPLRRLKTRHDVAVSSSSRLDTPLSLKMTTDESKASSSVAEQKPLNPLLISTNDPLIPQPPDEPPTPFVYDAENPELLFSRSKALIDSDLGLRNPSLLSDDDFIYIGPNVEVEGPLSKKEYLAAGRFFDLRSTFPDLDYRSHDYRVDSQDELTVRVTVRVVGTMKGELKLRKETLPPNGEKMVCPPEAISITFDKATGKVTKLCSGFTMDRLVGNTAGLTGVMAAATIAGAQPSDWEVYPPTVVLSRIFGRSIKQLKEPTSLEAPFPETVLTQLAKGVIAADNGAKDPDLLSPSFTFCGPLVGPIGKKEFVEAFGSFNLKEAFPDLDTDFSNFRVDPYDPYRVWVDGRGSGTWTGPLQGKEGNGARYEGPPEAISFTFDNNGFCTRLTAGAVMDPTVGNTGGLGGVFGIFYATGSQTIPGFASRPLPQLLARAEKAIAQPFTGVDVDDLTLTSKKKKPAGTDTDSKAPPAPPAPKAVVPLPATSAKSPPAAQKITPPALPKVELPKIKPPKVTPPKKPKSASKVVAAKKEKPKSSEDALARLKEEAASKKKNAEERIKRVELEAAERRKKEEAEKRAAAQQQKKQEIEAKRVAALEAKKAAEEKRKREAEERRQAAEEKKLLAEQKRKKVDDKRKAKQAEQLAANAKPGASISLFGLGQPKDVAPKRLSIAPPKITLPKADLPKVESKKTKQESKDKEEEAFARAKAQREANAAKKQASVELAKKKAEAAARAKAEKEAAAEARKVKAEAAATKRKEEAQRRKVFAMEAAEKRKQAAEAARAKKEEAAAKREANAAAMKQKKREAEERRAAAEDTVQKSSPGFTIRLFGGDSTPAPPPPPPSAPVQAPKAPPKAKAGASAVAPRGVPTISRWKQNRDGSISGFISGSPSFDDGDAITTSSIKGDVSGGIVVQTTSGSKYFLAPIAEKQRSITFSLFGGGAPKATPAPVPAQPTTARADVVKTAEAKRVAAKQAAEERKAAAEAKRREALAAAQARKEQQAKQAEERKAAAEARKAEAETKRAAAAEAAAKKKEQQRRQLEERKAAAEARKQEAEAKRAATLEAAAQRKSDAEAKMNAKKARESVAKAKPGGTISLFGFFPAQDETSPAPPSAPKKAAPKARVLSSAPRGIPILSKFRKNRDGSISGYIFGSSSFDEGETITTSQITTSDAVPGTVVETSSGSKYFLDSGMDKVLKEFQAKKRQEAQAAAKKIAEEKKRLAQQKREELEAKKAAASKAKQASQVVAKAKPGASISLFGNLGQKGKDDEEKSKKIASKKAEQLVAKAKPGASISLFGLGGGGSGAQAAKKDNVAANAKKAKEMVAKAKPGATIPLFGGPAAPKKEAATLSGPEKLASGSKPRATISLFGVGGQEEQPKRSAATKKAPKGIPSMVRWRRNFDGSLTGFISGSSAFAEGERITTSPIKKGIELKSGSTVETESGSKYFLV